MSVGLALINLQPLKTMHEAMNAVSALSYQCFDSN